MRLSSIRYYWEEAFRSIVRNRLMSVTSMLTVASCIFILVFSYCLALNIDYILEQFESAIGVSVFLREDATSEQVDTLYNELEAMPDVEDVTFISADDALQSFAEGMGDESGFVSAYADDNPLPRSFTLTLRDIESQDAVITALEQLSHMGIEKVVNARKTISSLVTVNHVIRFVSVLIVLVLGVLSVVIIMNTIKLTVNNRRTDIGIMKYVGATDWFIKWPFVIEGIVIGVVGALVPVGLSALGYGGILDAAESYIGQVSILRLKEGFEIFPTLLPMMVVLGVFIGALGSVLSMRKYLDV